MYYFLYGPDTYRRQQRLQEIITAYARKHPQGGVQRILGEEALAELDAALKKGANLFGSSQLLIVYDALAAQGKELLAFLSSRKEAQEETTVIFIEGAEAKKADLKTLQEYCTKTEAFPYLSRARRAQWARTYVKKNGSAEGPRKIEGSAVERIAEHAEATAALTMLLDQCMAYAAGRNEITEEDVRVFLPLAQEETIFKLSDGVCERNAPKALQAMVKLTSVSQSTDGLLGYTIKEGRNLVRAHAFAEARASSAESFRTLFGMKPFTWKLRSKQARNWEAQEIPRFLSSLVSLEYRWKRGADKRLALEQLVLEYAQK